MCSERNIYHSICQAEKAVPMETICKYSSCPKCVISMVSGTSVLSIVPDVLPQGCLPMWGLGEVTILAEKKTFFFGKFPLCVCLCFHLSQQLSDGTDLMKNGTI